MAKTRDDLQDVQVIHGPGTGNGKGLTFGRHFSTEGTHPFDEVEWETAGRGHPELQGGRERLRAERRRVPRRWSQNATNIVAQKYFRGTPGDPAARALGRVRSSSRVVDTIPREGREAGVLRHGPRPRSLRGRAHPLLVNQKAAFNSPVWFNVGCARSAAAVHRVPAVGALVSTPDGTGPDRETRRGEPVGAKVHDSAA